MHLATVISAAMALGAVVTPSAAAALAKADAHFALRAEGARGGEAATTQVEAALFDYRRALVLDPSSYEARLGLLRALFFRGGFCEIAPREQIKLFEEAKRLAEDTVRRLDSSSGTRPARTAALRRVPLAAEIHMWAAISWGQWAVDHKIAAAWQGAAERIRDLSQAVIDIDPATAQGGGHLILGRLHAEAPRLPILSRWVSRKKGIEHLRAALAIAPANTPNMYFLADALLKWSPSGREEARALLSRCASAIPRPEYLVEDAHYSEMAQRRLAALR